MMVQTIKISTPDRLGSLNSKVGEQTKIARSPVFREQIVTGLEHKFLVRGYLIMPCIPSLLDEYWRRFDRLFETLGITPTPEKLAELRQQLIEKINQGFQESPHAKIKIDYQTPLPPKRGLNFNLTSIEYSLVAQYQNWLSHRKPPLFGTHPDAKLMAVVTEFDRSPEEIPVLDVGAGTGRNTIPLALLGYPVDAIELTPEFAAEIRLAAQKFKLPIRVIEGNVLDDRQVNLRSHYYQLIIISEVISHLRSVKQLRKLLATMCDRLREGGLLLFNCFLPIGNYQPNQIAREIAESEISSIFTREELAWAMAKLPLKIISDQSAVEFERQHQPIEAWPPTGWYCDWATGRDVFWKSRHQPPIELRWLLCRRG